MPLYKPAETPNATGVGRWLRLYSRPDLSHCSNCISSSSSCSIVDPGPHQSATPTLQYPVPKEEIGDKESAGVNILFDQNSDALGEKTGTWKFWSFPWTEFMLRSISDVRTCAARKHATRWNQRVSSGGLSTVLCCAVHYNKFGRGDQTTVLAGDLKISASEISVWRLPDLTSINWHRVEWGPEDPRIIQIKKMNDWEKIMAYERVTVRGSVSWSFPCIKRF